MYNAKIILDSCAKGFGDKNVRLTTVEVTMPRIVLAEFNTHRVFSRNSASSRAIPVEKRIAAVKDNPFIPEAFAANKRGMQAGEELDDRDNSKARDAWLRACDDAIRRTEELLDIGVHKQWANRLIEPFSWQTIICTATEWDNFFALRCSKAAQPEIRKAANLIGDAMQASEPEFLRPGQWHLPLTDDRDKDLGILDKIKVSVARCARVSYLTHDGRRDVQADLDLYDKLLTSGHMSPMEHAAMVNVPEQGLIMAVRPEFRGNFRHPFVQHRKMIIGEDVFNGQD